VSAVCFRTTTTTTAIINNTKHRAPKARPMINGMLGDGDEMCRGGIGSEETLSSDANVVDDND
jgi:hypothetical protein